MRRKRLLLMLGTLAVAGVIVLAWPRGPRDPVYEGKRLSQWLAEAYPWKTWSLSEDAGRAVKSIGSNAVPFLLSEFECGEPKWLEDFKQGRFVSRTLGLRFKPKQIRRDRAICALGDLGPDAWLALPTLARYFDDPERGRLAVEVVSKTGDAGNLYLLKALWSTNAAVRYEALFHLELTIPIVIQLLDHPDSRVRARVIKALGGYPSVAFSSVAALRRAASDCAPEVRQSAESVLKGLSIMARPEVLELLRLPDEPDWSGAQLAIDPVTQFDPSALPLSRP